MSITTRLRPCKGAFRKFAAAGVALLSACFMAASVQAADAKMTNLQSTVSQINPNAKITWVNESPIPGLSEVGVDGVVLYISDDGRYLIHGTLLDVVNRKNLTELAGAKTRAPLLAEIKDSDKIVFQPMGQVKHRIVVFTDISCGYCQKLHENINGYLQRGIQVEYVAFPRGGAQSPVLAQMDNIWCSKDRKSAYDGAMHGKIPNQTSGCMSPVKATYEIGDKLGIQGTPAIYTYDGIQHGGFVDPEELAQELDQGRKPGEPDAADAD